MPQPNYITSLQSLTAHFPLNVFTRHNYTKFQKKNHWKAFAIDLWPLPWKLSTKCLARQPIESGNEGWVFYFSDFPKGMPSQRGVVGKKSFP